MPAKPKRRWSELSPAKRRGIVALGAAQVSLQLAALIDLRGPKRVWATASFVNWLGPLAYFACGRRRTC